MNEFKDKDISERILGCIRNKDIEGLKAIKEQIGRNQWLNQWGGKSVPIEAWLEPNPFITFK